MYITTVASLKAKPERERCHFGPNNIQVQSHLEKSALFDSRDEYCSPGPTIAPHLRYQCIEQLWQV